MWDLVTRAGLGTSGSKKEHVPGVGVVVAVPGYSFLKSNCINIYFWPCWVVAAVSRLSLVAASRGSPLLWCLDSH